VVHEYLDVFPNDLLGMPHHRAIEFKIELQSGTALVYKQPYPMAQNEMAELKTQLQELLNKGYIQPQLFSMGLPCYVCVEEGQDAVVVRRLLTTQCSNREEQVSIASH
jgi:hypothetical protein